MLKRAAVFDPYLDSIGGGEVYTSTVIESLIKNNFYVEIFWKSWKIKRKIKKYLGIDISNTQINTHGYNLFRKKGKLLKKVVFTKKFDLIFFLSDGSIPWTFSRNNILHFQVPFQSVRGKSFLNQLKFKNIHHIICNSNFTKKFIDREFAVNSEVVYPPINIHPQKTKKENIVLSVGRFTQALHNKRQDLLVETYKNMVDRGLKDWELKLVGSDKEGKSIVRNLKKKIQGYPIKIVTNITHKQLEEEYSKAKIYWHAAGFQVDQEKNPELVEHFGIATAEAMSAGCVPIVINLGGQPEIVNNGKDGYLWDSIIELRQKTLQLISARDDLASLSRAAIKKSKQFSKTTFMSKFSRIAV
jgi:glycosyltransferase involved in cell wall biosynthesis